MLGQDSRDNGSEVSAPPAATSGGGELEIELKLAGAAGALEELWTSAIAARTSATSRHLISTYYDTSDLRLRRRGFTLRVRQVGVDFVQTV